MTTTNSTRAAARTASLIAVTSVMLAQGCAQQQGVLAGSSRRLYQIDQIGGAHVCNVPAVTTQAGATVDATMTVGNDGGWCGMPVSQGGRDPFSAGLLTTKPAHGRVYIHTVGDATRIDYTPARAYVGSDGFTVTLLPGAAVVHVAVTVTGVIGNPVSK